MSTYVIGDIHGSRKIYYLTSFLHQSKEANKKFIFVGDYINKGEYTRDILDFLIYFRKSHECIFLMGNHEYKLLHRDVDFFNKYGGIQTYKSYLNIDSQSGFKYDINSLNKLILTMDEIGHLDFIKKMHIFYKEKDFYILHSGFNPDIENQFLSTTISDIMAIDMKSIFFSRTKFINSKKLLEGRKIIFGHTSFNYPYVDDYKIGIDTGVAYGGEITAFCIETETFINSRGQKYDLTYARKYGGKLYE